MAKIPLGPKPDPNDESLNAEQLREAPLPAIPISPAELQKLGLAEPLAAAALPHSAVRPEDKVSAFVAAVAPAARDAAERLNVPVEAVISQWALESGWGQSELARKYNNLGGIKASPDWKGQSVRMPSYEKNRSVLETSPFRVYDNMDSYGSDFSNFLSRPRYSAVRGTNSVTAYGNALGQAGYHQDEISSYTKQLESIANRVRPFLSL